MKETETNINLKQHHKMILGGKRKLIQILSHTTAYMYLQM